MFEGTMIDGSILQETQANRDLFTRVLIDEIDGVVAPLLRLDERARASIIALVGAAQLITAYQRLHANRADNVGDDFDAILYSLHPDGAALLAGLRTTGLAESVAYGWTLALHRNEQSDEDEAGATHRAAAEVACAMSHLDALMDVLKSLRLPVPVASDRPQNARPAVIDFPPDWEPARHDM
jgi:hypothetical protein